MRKRRGDDLYEVPKMPATVPCASCPWRVEAEKEDIPGYSAAKARKLLSRCCGEGDAYRGVMACHHSTPVDPRICVGYLAKEGEKNIMVRVFMSAGKCPHPYDVLDACEAQGIELHEDYAAVLVKLERDG